MSVTRVVYVNCDGCQDNVGSDLADTGLTAKEQRDYARNEGWKVGLPGGRDLCPDCVKEAV